MYLQIATPTIPFMAVIIGVLVVIGRIIDHFAVNYFATRNPNARQSNFSYNFDFIVGVQKNIIFGLMLFLMLWFSIDPKTFGDNVYRFIQVITFVFVLEYLKFFLFWISRNWKRSPRPIKIKNK